MSVTAEILTGGKPVPALKEMLPEGLEYGEYGENYVLKEAESLAQAAAECHVAIWCFEII